MDSSKPTIIFVHGGFHDSTCFRPLPQILKDAGYSCVDDLDLPGSGSTASLEEDAEAVRSAVLKTLDGGKDCILVMHSYGAVPANQGLKGLSKKDRGDKPAVLKMVYMNANLPKEGDSHLEQFQAYHTVNNTSPPNFLEIKGGLVHFVRGGECFYNDVPEDKQKELLSKLKPQSLLTLVTPLSHTTYKDIPSWFLSGTNDVVMPPAFHQYMFSDIGETMEVVEQIDTGHCPFLAQPAQVADFIVRAAKSAMGNALRCVRTTRMG